MGGIENRITGQNDDCDLEEQNAGDLAAKGSVPQTGAETKER